jgi:hypothetical protein
MRIVVGEDRVVNNRWTQIGVSFFVQSGKDRKRKAVFECSCGSRDVLNVSSIRTGHSKSCGCLSHELLSKRNTTHGMSHTTEYEIWLGMLKRCRNPNCHAYERYGGRGIDVCERWESFENFFSDMGNRPEGMSIDRVDNDKGYFLDNCRWASPMQQARNSRMNKIVNVDGVSMCISEWAEVVGMKQDTVGMRMLRGWSGEKAVTTPLFG